MGSTESYRSETQQAVIGERSFTIIHLFPVFTSEDEREQVRQNIEHGLYCIFEKYSHI